MSLIIENFVEQAFPPQNVNYIAISEEDIRTTKSKTIQRLYSQPLEGYLQQEIDYRISRIKTLNRKIKKPLQIIENIPITVDVRPSIVKDLKSLEQQLTGFSINDNGPSFAFNTPFITLRDIPMGRFRIGIRSRAFSSHCITFTSLDTKYNHTGGDGNIHPHINSGGTLCAGEAGEPIGRALREKRYYDVAQIIINTLQTYGNDPYVRLERWVGTLCEDCGDTCGDVCDCADCGRETLCENCTIECRECSNYFCGNCIYSCRGCGNSHCKECTQRCNKCEENYCLSCTTICCHNCERNYCGSCLDNNILLGDCLICNDSVCLDCKGKTLKDVDSGVTHLICQRCSNKR